jgi:carboxyl-terminal processing protease
MRRVTFLVAGLGLVLVGAVAGHWIHDRTTTPPDSEAFRTLRSAYEVIRESYVDPVPSGSLATTSIEGMVGSLDPFSVYISTDRMKQVEETLSGSFEGIGVSYELIDGPRGADTIAVVSVVPDGPSAEAGLRAGDRIVEVEGESAVGWSHDTIQRRLKGPEGSAVEVTLRRPGSARPVDTTITRDTVPLETVQAAYMLDERTGYVQLTRFARTTHRELTRALQTLGEKGMERLVLDLRGNAGGLMSMAEKVADEFLVDGQLIVTARSRHPEYGGARHATADGQFEETPMVVLVDQHSASASEIVAGALQDHDRAVLVGRPTFGKGMVQRQFDLADGSGLRLTVARFYTPSGRLLQRTSDERRDTLLARPDSVGAVPPDVPDSLVHRTDAGRVVMGGGGLRPDRLVSDSIRNAFRRAVETNGIVRDFARQWIDARSDSLRARWAGRAEAFARAFALPETVYPAFLRYAAERGVRARSGALAPVPAGASTVTTTAADRGERFGPDGVRAARSEIETTIAGYVALRLFGPAMQTRLLNRTDPVLEHALAAWPLAERWAQRYPVR